MVTFCELLAPRGRRQRRADGDADRSGERHIDAIRMGVIASALMTAAVLRHLQVEQLLRVVLEDHLLVGRRSASRSLRS